MIPAKLSCAIYVKQVALQSNDTTSSSITPSFLPQAISSLLFQDLFLYMSDTFRGGVGSI